MRSSFSPLVAVLIVVGTLSVSCGALTADSINARLPEIQLPRGFKIELYQDGIRNARSMVLGDQGTLFVGTRTDGGVYAIVDKNKDGKGDGVVPIFKSKTLPDGKETVMPNGVAFKDGALYVATVSHILRFDDIESHLNAPPIRSSSLRTIRRNATTVGSSSASGRTASSTCRSARRVTFVNPTRPSLR